MIQLNDLHQSTVDAAKIVDVKMRDRTCGYFYGIKCKLADESVLSFVYSGKDALHADYQKLLMVAALNSQIAELATNA
jgi:hypothetical protein